MERKYKERIGKKMKVMLVCNAGMSTGILAKKIEEASDGKLECKAYGEAEYLDHIKEGYELLLIGPQIRHLKKLKKRVMVNLNVKHMEKLNILTILKKAMNYC